MTSSQKLEVRLSAIRQRLNAIAGLEGDAMTDEIRVEADALTAEFEVKETQFRAATIAEGDEQRRAEGEFGAGDGEPAETRALLARVHLPDYLGAAAAGIGLAGAPVELAAALESPIVGASGGVAIPWRILAGPAPVEMRRDPVEARAFTSTSAFAGGVVQRPILQRLFGPGVFDQLGVRVDTVPAGRSEWPLIVGGVAPDQAVEGTAAADAVAAVFATETLKPKRLTGKYEYTHEMAAQVLALEPALRRDLADAVRSKMSDLIMNGNESSNAHEPDGFLTKIAAPSDPVAASAYADYAGAHAAAVDGIHASAEDEVSSVIGVASYAHSARVYQSGSGESGSEALKRRSAACMASSFVPAATSDIQNGNIFHAGGPNGGGADLRGDSIAAIWPVLEVIRDPYSQASTGVVLTWVTLWDAETAFRAAAYRRIAFQLA